MASNYGAMFSELHNLQYQLFLTVERLHRTDWEDMDAQLMGKYFTREDVDALPRRPGWDRGLLARRIKKASPQFHGMTGGLAAH